MSKAEKFIRENTRNKVNHITENFPWVPVVDARKAVEIAREEIYEWIKNNAYSYTWCDYLQQERGMEISKLIDDLKQAMKDE